MPSVAILGTRGYPSYYGGFETAVRKLAPYLADEGWDVTVYGRPGATRVNDPTYDDRVRSVTTWGIEAKSTSTLSFGWSASRHAIRAGHDVALVMNVANGFWLKRFVRAGIPTLVNVDGIEWERAKWNSTAKKVFLMGAQMTAASGTRLVYDSREIARRWHDKFGVGGVFIPYGGELLHEELPLEPGLAHRKYVLIVARFVPENTVEQFLEAAPMIAEHTDVVIVGSSGYGGYFDERARDLDIRNSKIHWLGHVSDDRRLHSLWQHAGAYFHGHSVGGTNPALVQAMACGAPIVARDTVFNREVVGDCGIFVAPTPGAIAESLLSLIANPQVADKLATKARGRAATNYSWSLVNEAYDSALTELLDVRRK